ncbi:terminase small subunit [Latilactobacillus curvatus]|uniref:terminase small subunit n=1 Tax=Latilactobacillus curvatus TaxID=28038 RepID=UPI0020741C7E|nr:terminase small subunit [Latilactobacillus curvatus]MCM6843401.1 terminase small subunit [Latilactobacillus curvatus]MCM6861747.1 terminase small subunit [Latilactobacillus curvatus]MCM6869014.1 terminase small subunit [Latilactobacillus curvatus]UTB76379.1 terminase [Latilactobacillus curvatus]
MKLSEKQKRFADEYIKTGNATQSAKVAGYKQPHVQGSQNLEKLSVKTYIDEKLEQLASERIMSAQQALELLTKIAKGEEKETVIVGTPDGVYESEKEADLKTRIAAVKEILKRYPTENPLTQAQIRKLEAEADIKEAQAAEAKNMTDSSSEVMIVDDIPED